MANKTFNGLDTLRADGTVAGTDVVVLSQADSEGGANDVAKKTTVGDLATTVGTELGLGTAATTASTDYATAAQGVKADTALQSGDDNTALTNAANFITAGQAPVQDVTAGTGVTVTETNGVYEVSAPGSSAFAVTSEEIAGATPPVSDGTISQIVQLTQAQYESITPASDIVYVITGGDVTVTANVQGAASNTVNRIVTIDQAAYDGLGGSVDPNTLYVIEDGVTKDSYVGQIDTLEAKTYYIDIQPIADYTIYSVFLQGTDAGSTGTIDLQIDGVSQDIDGAGTGGVFDFDAGTPDTLPFGGVAVPLSTPLTGTAGQSISLVVTGTPAVTDFSFVVEYGV